MENPNAQTPADDGATTANNGGQPMPTSQPAIIQKLLDNLPGLIGGVDWAIKDKTGQYMPFLLLVFTGNGAAHAQNFDAAEANRLIIHFAKQIAASDPEAMAILYDTGN